MLRTIHSLLTVWRILRGTPAFSKQFIFDVNTSAYGINSPAERSVKCSKICISWVWFPGSMENAIKERQWDLGETVLLTSSLILWPEDSYINNAAAEHSHYTNAVLWSDELNDCNFKTPHNLPIWKEHCTVQLLPSWSCLGEWFFAMVVRSILLSKASVPVICSSQIQSSTMQRCG